MKAYRPREPPNRTLVETLQMTDFNVIECEGGGVDKVMIGMHAYIL